MVVLTTSATGDEHFVKFYSSTHASHDVEREVAFTETLASQHIPVPHYVTRRGGDFVHTVPHPNGANPVTVSRKIDGTHPQRYTPSLLDVVAMQHGRIHQVSLAHRKGRPLNPQSDYHYFVPDTTHVELQSLQTAIRPIIRHIMELWEALPNGLVHLDITRSNLLADDEALTGIIDFEDLSIAPLSFCLAGTMWDIMSSGGTPDDIAAYQQRYSQERALTVAEKAILPHMVAMRGWIALHGALLTDGLSSRAADKHSTLLAKNLI